VTDTVTPNRAALVHRGRRLEYFTITWNAIEGLVAVFMGVIAGSISLVGFGLDSFVEVTSGSVLLWRMSVDADCNRRELNERRALRFVACVSCCWPFISDTNPASDLLLKSAPEHSVPGIILACVSLIVMPLLSRAKRTVARAIGSGAMSADAKQTEFCTLSVGHLACRVAIECGLWILVADPIAASSWCPL